MVSEGDRKGGYFFSKELKAFEKLWKHFKLLNNGVELMEDVSFINGRFSSVREVLHRRQRWN